MGRHGQAGATTFEYAVMLGLVLFALLLVAVSLADDHAAADVEQRTCATHDDSCELAVR